MFFVQAFHFLGPKDYAFFITIDLAIFLWIVSQKATLGQRDIFGFHELVEELLRREEYPELFSLIDRYWYSLIKIQSKKFLIPKMRFLLKKKVSRLDPELDLERYISTLSTEELNEIINAVDVSKGKKKRGQKKKDQNKNSKMRFPKQNRIILFFRKTLWRFAEWLISFLPDYTNYANIANDLFRMIFYNEKFRGKFSEG